MSKYESLLERVAEIKKECSGLREDIIKNPSRQKVIEASLERLESELVECSQKFIELAGLNAEFNKFSNDN